MAANIKLTDAQIKTLAAAVLGLGALGYVYVAFFWLPISKKINDADTLIQTTEQKITGAKAVASQKARLEAELASLQEQAAEANRRLPTSKSTPDILVTLADLADRNGVDLMSFAPPSVSNKQFFSELSYPLTVSGHYHDLGKFLAALSLEERIFNVQNINFGAPGAEGQLNVTFKLISYFKPDEGGGKGGKP